ncbi:MAG: hypothetical protein PHR70_09270, partial [Tissierellia bacterium]|nr:hypothetical protein [Tissierellia bacterium]
CVLSTGFPELSPEVSPICSSFPTLFPRQIDDNSDEGSEGDSDCRRPKFRLGANRFEDEEE